MPWIIWVVVAVAVVLIVAVAVFVGKQKRQITPSKAGKSGELLKSAGLAKATPQDGSTGSAVVVEPTELVVPVEPDSPQVAASPTSGRPGEQLENPEAPSTRFARLRRRLSSSNNALARAIAELLSRDRLDEDTWDEFETVLISSDLGIETTSELIAALRKELAIDGVNDSAQARRVLRKELVRVVNPDLDRSLRLARADGAPAVVLVVGVNGTGKTTTVGKLARMLRAEDKTVLLGAADTFRAAASEQLTTWGERVGVETVCGREGADPAAVAFDAVKTGIKNGVDVVLVDTAGRLHTKAGLMDELGKVKRVIEKQTPVSEVLLVIDATTGQNGMVQAKVFSEVVDVTGIVLTKLDGSAKGGIVIRVQRELGVPVKFVGLGEGVDDLAPFDAAQFVNGLLGE